jgi:hypothetical protein
MSTETRLGHRLRNWPHRKPGIGVDGNTMLAGMVNRQILTLSETRKLSASSPLGQLIKHKLVAMVTPGKDPTYQVTDAGIEYHRLLTIDNLITQPE